jgi:hypothetical protein
MQRVREGEKELDCVRVQDGKLPQAGMQRYEGRAARLQPFRRPGGDLDLRQHGGRNAVWRRQLLEYARAPCLDMNQIVALDPETHLPFGHQQKRKVVCINFFFSPATRSCPDCGSLHMSRRTGSTDRYNLLRVFKPPPRTTDRTVTMSMLYIFPRAVFGHLLSAIFNERV